MKDCKLLATLPPLTRKQNIENVFADEGIFAVRYNSGVASPYKNKDIIDYLSTLSKKHNKPLWIDLKGRQLRIAKWADPYYDCIELNHEIELNAPARIMLRGDDSVNIVESRGKQIWVDPIPKEAVGAGQSVNILCDDMKIKGYLTPNDIELLQICKAKGLNNIMASFVENESDLDEVKSILPNANIICKIESIKGIDFARRNPTEKFMAARDDLYIQNEKSYSTINMLRLLVQLDKDAICASRIFSSLEKAEEPSLADFCDLELMNKIGYKKFMLCDNISNYHFKKAMNAWGQFIEKPEVPPCKTL